MTGMLFRPWKLARVGQAGRTSIARSFELAPEVLEIKIILTGVFYDIGIRNQTYLFCHRPWLGIDLRVVDRYFEYSGAQSPSVESAQ